MIEVILFFLAAALILYVVLAGADFGGGILELFPMRDEERRVISRAIAPVWEANHVWLILVVVILFTAFPKIYTVVSVALHLPILALLVGISMRGCAFTFRHYDTGTEYHRVYTGIFVLSSLWSAFFLGVLGGAVSLGRLDPDASDFVSAYLFPWANAYSYAVGAFTTALFAFLASVYLVGEGESEAFRGKAKRAAIAMVVAGGFVFLAAELSGLKLFRQFFSSPVSLACFLAAGIAWWPFLVALQKHPQGARVLAAGIVTLVLVGWFAMQYPVAVRFTEGALTFSGTAAPPATLRALVVALGVGIVIIFPALAYLFKVFKVVDNSSMLKLLIPFLFCVTASADLVHDKLGVKNGQSYKKAKAKILKKGFHIVPTNLDVKERLPDKAFPEVLCGRIQHDLEDRPVCVVAFEFKEDGSLWNLELKRKGKWDFVVDNK